MLFGFNESLQPGDTVDIALEFLDSDGASQTIITTADVKALGD